MTRQEFLNPDATRSKGLAPQRTMTAWIAAILAYRLEAVKRAFFRLYSRLEWADFRTKGGWSIPEPGLSPRSLGNLPQPLTHLGAHQVEEKHQIQQSLHQCRQLMLG